MSLLQEERSSILLSMQDSGPSTLNSLTPLSAGPNLPCPGPAPSAGDSPGTPPRARMLNSDQRDTESLIAELRAHPDERLREAIIERCRPLVETLARKFVRTGVSEDDLVQTAWLALIKALDRFDPEHATKFTTYAAHCIVGEIKRYFRDRTWAMKVPRHLQEIASSLPKVQDRLVQELGRKPAMSEMATRLGITEETLIEAMELQQSYQPTSLDDRPTQGGDETDGRTIAETLGREDAQLAALIEYAPLQAALRQLDPCVQTILRRHLCEGFSQQEVAAQLGMSQMQVSRMERAGLEQLRAAFRSRDNTA